MESPINEAIRSVDLDKINDLMAVDEFDVDVDPGDPCGPDESDETSTPRKGRNIKPKLDSKSLTVMLDNATIKKIRMIAIFNDRTIRDEVEYMVNNYYDSIKDQLFK